MFSWQFSGILVTLDDRFESTNLPKISISVDWYIFSRLPHLKEYKTLEHPGYENYYLSLSF